MCVTEVEREQMCETQTKNSTFIFQFLNILKEGGEGRGP